jgi:hypothetical protein
MKEELYRKVYIKSEADLPECTGEYIASFALTIHNLSFGRDNKENRKYWLDQVDWYLHPIGEQIEQKEYKTAEEFGVIDIAKWLNEKGYRRGMDIYLGEIAGLIKSFMEEYRQQGQSSDEDIEEWIYNDAHWAKTFINGAIYGAQSMRDRLIQKR